MDLGSWQLDAISGGRFRLDGGAMFGVVPKPLWSRRRPADERNRIDMAANCILARDGAHTVLIDTGYGDKLSENERDIYAAESGSPLIESLANRGVSPDDVDTVILTHLHFDHAGGCTARGESDTIRPAFPKARYVVQRHEWQDAASGAPELAGSYPTHNFLPLADADCLDLLDGDAEIVPGIRCLVTGGHTRGHQVLLIESSGRTAFYSADLCPTAAHLPTMWCMAYDVDVLETRRTKPRFLARAADEEWIVLWGHDPDMTASRLVVQPNGRVEVAEAIDV